MPYLKTRDSNLWYETTGSGKPVVFIHGLGASGQMWRPQVQAFESACQVVTYDVRGHGRSDPLGPECDLKLLAADVESLLTHLGIESAVICGVSFGGVVAQRFALDYAGRCAGLVLVDTFSSLGRPLTTLLDATIWLGARLALPFYFLPRAAMAAIRRRRFSRWQLAREYALQGDGLAGRDYYTIRRALNQVDYNAELHRITCPTLGVVGAGDIFMRRFMENLAAHIPMRRKVVVPDAIDPTPLCQPEIFTGLMSEFLGELGWAKA